MGNIVQYFNVHRNQRVTRNLHTPKRMTEIKYWIKEVQKTIKECPKYIAPSLEEADNSTGSDGWFVMYEDVTIKWIKLEIHNKFGEKAHIVISRGVSL